MKRWALAAAVIAFLAWLTAALERFEREFPCGRS